MSEVFRYYVVFVTPDGEPFAALWLAATDDADATYQGERYAEHHMLGSEAKQRGIDSLTISVERYDPGPIRPSLAQFALFAGDDYYPSGGWEDYVDTFATVDDAQTAKGPADDWAHVVDLSTREIVSRYQRPFGWGS